MEKQALIHMLVRHKVADFARWKKVFDSHKEAQEKAGLKLKHLWRNIDDQNEVFFLFEVEDLKKAQAFLSSQDPKVKDEAGVTDEPDLYFLN